MGQDPRPGGGAGSADLAADPGRANRPARPCRARALFAQGTLAGFLLGALRFTRASLRLSTPLTPLTRSAFVAPNSCSLRSAIASRERSRYATGALSTWPPCAALDVCLSSRDGRRLPHPADVIAAYASQRCSPGRRARLPSEESLTGLLVRPFNAGSHETVRDDAARLPQRVASAEPVVISGVRPMLQGFDSNPRRERPSPTDT